MAPIVALIFALLFTPAQDYLSDGLKALDDKQPALAEPLFRKAIEADSKDYGAHFNLALALSLQHKDAEAIAELRTTLELKPALYEADLNLGILLLRNKQPGDAVTVLKEATQSKPSEIRASLYYAQALLETGDAAAAEQNYRRVIGLDPRSAAGQLGLGQALLKQGKLQEAVEQFRASGNKDGMLNVAAQYEDTGHRREAMDIYREFPDNPAVTERLGRMLVDDKNAADAIPKLEDAVRRAPVSANRLALADAYKLAGQPAKMLEQLQLAAAADANNYDLRMSYGRALRDDHKLTAAADQFLAAAKLRPDSVQAWNELASVAIVAQNYSQGLAALDRVHALGKDIPGDYFLRAITLDKLKQFPQALAAYAQFLVTDGGAHPDQEFQARQRTRIIENELKRK